MVRVNFMSLANISGGKRVLSQRDLTYLLVLHGADGIGPRTARRLLANFSCLDDLLSADWELLRKFGVTENGCNDLKRPNWRLIDFCQKWATFPQQRILLLSDPSYPVLLKETYDAPLLLFVKGDASILGDVQLAMVGSRNPSPTGRENAYAFARDLALSGLIITSGLAYGIDAASHKGALAAKGRTVAVMGTGLDCIYPAKNARLADDIANSGGALVSEFTLGMGPIASNFPQRNRIISGLSIGVLVVEATMMSGSLITARFALEQGREVFAIPSSIHNPLAKGCHSLLRQGAKLVEGVQDVLEEIKAIIDPNILAVRDGKVPVVPVSGKLNDNLPIAEVNSEVLVEGDECLRDEDQCVGGEESCEGDQCVVEEGQGGRKVKEQQILDCISHEATPVDILVARSNLTISEITSILLDLELANKVISIPGGYVRM
jgi:DNA processing protein